MILCQTFGRNLEKITILYFESVNYKNFPFGIWYSDKIQLKVLKQLVHCVHTITLVVRDYTQV